MRTTDSLREGVTEEGAKIIEQGRYGTKHGWVEYRIVERTAFRVEQTRCPGPGCGKWFVKISVGQVYCSSACRQRAYRQRMKNVTTSRNTT